MSRSIPGAFALALMAVLAAGCGPKEGSAPIEAKSIEIEMGAAGLLSDDRWTVVRVKARAAGKVFRGDVEVSGIDGRGAAAPERYRKRFEASIEPQTIEIPVLPRGWQKIVVTFRGEGIGEESLVQPISWGPSVKFRILVIGTQSSAVLPKAFEETLGSPIEEIEVKAAAPRDLPRHFLGYQAADLVVIDGDSLAEVDPDRLESLREWIQRGGTAAAVPGPKWSGKLPEKAAELFGLEKAARSEEIAGEPPRPAAPGSKEAIEARPQLYNLDPQPEAKLVEGGFLLERRLGSGAAYLHAIAPPGIFPGELPLPQGVLPAWKRVLGRVLASRKDLNGLEAFESEAIQVLSGYSGLRYPSRTKAILFVIGYAAVGLVLSGLLFGRSKRLERMYIVAAALAVLSSIGIWRFGILSGIQEFGIDEIVVAKVRPGSALADARTYVGLSSPTRRVLRPEIPEGRPGPWISSQPPAMVIPLDYRVSGQSIDIPEIPLLPNASRFLRFDGPLDLGGKLEAVSGTGAGGKPLVKVKNSTAFPLRLFFISPTETFDLKSLQAGASSEIELERSLDFIRPNYLLRRRLIRSIPHGSTCLVAELERPMSAASFLGPIRHSTGFLVLEVPAEEDL